MPQVDHGRRSSLAQTRLDGLGHEDFFVRSVMLGVVAHEPHPGPEAARRVLQQIDRHGWSEAFEFPHQVTSLPQSEETVEWVANWLERSAPDSSRETTEQQIHLARWLCKAPLELFRPHLDRFVETIMAELPPKTGTIYSDPVRFKNSRVSFESGADRLVTACLSIGECSDRLDGVLAACAQAEEFPHQLVAQLEVLCESLATRNALSRETISGWLEAATPTPDGALDADAYRAAAALLLIAHRAETPPLDPVLRLFNYDWDWMSELIDSALLKTGDSETLGALLDRYATHNWSTRFSLSKIFENLRFPEHEQALREALRAEEEDDLRVNLAWALALYGSPESLALARGVALEYPGDPERWELLDLLCVHDILLGRESDETRRHHGMMERRRAEQNARRTEIEALIASASHAAISSPPPAPHGRKEKNVIPFRPAKPKPIAGRNDPCPCGSGKKFKKCCGP